MFVFIHSLTSISAETSCSKLRFLETEFDNQLAKELQKVVFLLKRGIVIFWGAKNFTVIPLECGPAVQT